MHQIGVGVLGPVYRAQDTVRDQLVAVKVFKVDAPPEQAEQIADALQAVVDALPRHRGLIEPIAAGVARDTAYLVTAHCDVPSLDTRLKPGVALDAEETLNIIRTLAEAIDAAHARGIVHGGLHPRDIFVDDHGGGRAAGFGVATALARAGVRVPVRRPYSPPERLTSAPIEPTADRFALGAIAFELLSGRRIVGTGAEAAARCATPVPGADPAADVEKLQTALAAMLAEQPAHRPSSAVAFAQALTLALFPRGLAHRPPAAVVSASPPAATPGTAGLPGAARDERQPQTGPGVGTGPGAGAVAGAAATVAGLQDVDGPSRDDLELFTRQGTLWEPKPRDDAGRWDKIETIDTGSLDEDPLTLFASESPAPDSPDASPSPETRGPATSPASDKGTGHAARVAAILGAGAAGTSRAADPGSVDPDSVDQGGVDQGGADPGRVDPGGVAPGSADQGGTPVGAGPVDPPPADTAARQPLVDHGVADTRDSRESGAPPGARAGSILGLSSPSSRSSAPSSVPESGADDTEDLDDASVAAAGAVRREADENDEDVEGDDLRADGLATDGGEQVDDQDDEDDGDVADDEEDEDEEDDEEAGDDSEDDVSARTTPYLRLDRDDLVQPSLIAARGPGALGDEPASRDDEGDEQGGRGTRHARDEGAAYADEMRAAPPPIAPRRGPYANDAATQGAAAASVAASTRAPAGSLLAASEPADVGSSLRVVALVLAVGLAVGGAGGYLIGQRSALRSAVAFDQPVAPETQTPAPAPTPVDDPQLVTEGDRDAAAASPRATGSTGAASPGNASARTGSAGPAARGSTAAPSASPSASSSGAPAGAPPVASAARNASTGAAANRAGAATGRLTVTSSPSRAEVAVNGVRRGVTPLTLRNLPLGALTVRVTRSGFAPESRRVSLVASKPSDAVAFDLEPTARRVAGTGPYRPASDPNITRGGSVSGLGALYIVSRPMGARVSVDGRAVGATPLMLTDVSSGSHTVQLQAPGHKAWTTTVRVAPGQRIRVAASLEEGT